MKKYKSKIGLGIVLFITIVLGGTSTIMIINHIWIGLIINLVVVGFISYLFMTTYYIINGNDLTVKCGFMVCMTIKIVKIKKIKETNNPLSSPAASLDRIAIYYNNTDSTMISPKDKMEFINQLTNINSKIEVIFKKDKIPAANKQYKLL